MAVQNFHNFIDGGTPALWGGTNAPTSATYYDGSRMVNSLIASEIFQKNVLPGIQQQINGGTNSGEFHAKLTDSPFYQPLKDITGMATHGYVWQDVNVSFVGSWDGTWHVVNVPCCGSNKVMVVFDGYNFTSAPSFTRTPWPKTWRYNPNSLQQEFEKYSFQHPVQSLTNFGPFGSILKDNPFGTNGLLKTIKQNFHFSYPVDKGTNK